MPANDPPRSNIPSGHVAIALVLAPHGVRGELKVEPFTTHAENFDTGRTLWIEETTHKVEASRRQKASFILRLSDVTTIEAAETLRGRLLSLPESDLAPLAEDEYYAYQIVGLDVYESDGARLGKVVDLIPTGANDVYVVRGPRGEILLPAVEDVILEVDVAGGRMVVSLMEGMLPARGD
jgi:16S rRNA processing protein RimM